MMGRRAAALRSAWLAFACAILLALAWPFAAAPAGAGPGQGHAHGNGHGHGAQSHALREAPPPCHGREPGADAGRHLAGPCCSAVCAAACAPPAPAGLGLASRAATAGPRAPAADRYASVVHRPPVPPPQILALA